MNPVILFGVVTVTLALVAYTVGMVAEHRRRRATAFVLGVFAVAVVFDLVATACMMIGSRKPWFTIHGVVGYVALLTMVGVVAMLWRLRTRGPDQEIPAGLHLGLRAGYVVWLVAYAIGATLAGRR